MPIELPALSAERPMLPADGAPYADVRVGPIALAVAAETTWDLTFEDRTDDVDGRVVRFAKVPVDRAPPFAKGAVLVYALAPFAAKASKPIALTLAETGGLPAGSAVDIVVMRDLALDGGPNGAGEGDVAAHGHVSMDGRSITTDAGEGIRALTWIAIRPSASK
jgi:hypothetical protein